MVDEEIRSEERIKEIDMEWIEEKIKEEDIEGNMRMER